MRATPEFRRLVDGAKAGLALIPKAVATRDSDLLHRVLIELRSFDNLLRSASDNAAPIDIFYFCDIFPDDSKPAFRTRE